MSPFDNEAKIFGICGVDISDFEKITLDLVLAEQGTLTSSFVHSRKLQVGMWIQLPIRNLYHEL